jgi:hypothetical protein
LLCPVAVYIELKCYVLIKWDRLQRAQLGLSSTFYSVNRFISRCSNQSFHSFAIQAGNWWSPPAFSWFYILSQDGMWKTNYGDIDVVNPFLRKE